MATITLTTEEYEALVAERNALRGECWTEWRGPYAQGQSQPARRASGKAHLRQLFDAKSEARGTTRRTCSSTKPKPWRRRERRSPKKQRRIEIPAHTRKKRGRKPLDPSCRATSSAMNCRESERVCAHDGAAWWKSASRSASNSTSFRSRSG
jgi:transposase